MLWFAVSPLSPFRMNPVCSDDEDTGFDSEDDKYAYSPTTDPVKPKTFEEMAQDTSNYYCVASYGWVGGHYTRFTHVFDRKTNYPQDCKMERVRP
jgi:hypothetical protein